MIDDPEKALGLAEELYQAICRGDHGWAKAFLGIHGLDEVVIERLIMGQNEQQGAAGLIFTMKMRYHLEADELDVFVAYFKVLFLQVVESNRAIGLNLAITLLEAKECLLYYALAHNQLSTNLYQFLISTELYIVALDPDFGRLSQLIRSNRLTSSECSSE